MSRELVAYVHVAGQVFAPGDDVPDEYAKKITNPAAWADGRGGSPESSAREGEPPRSGKGSGRETWAAYAAQRGVPVAVEMTRDDIVAALVKAGKIESGE